MSYTQGHQRRGRSAVALGIRDRPYCASFPHSLPLSCLHTCPCFANTVFMTESIQKLILRLPQVLRQEETKNSILRMGWGSKEMSGAAGHGEHRPHWSSRTDFPSPSECVCHSDYKRAHCGAVTDSGAQKWPTMKDLFPVLLVKTCCIPLDCLNVLKLICLSVCRVINELIGNLVGHLYFFLMFRYPMDLGGRNFLSTPQFL